MQKENNNISYLHKAMKASREEPMPIGQVAPKNFDRQAFLQSLQTFQSKVREREPEYDPPTYVVSDPAQKQCPMCKQPVNDIDTHGYLIDRETRKIVICPECSPPVIRNRGRRIANKYIMELVSNFTFLNQQNLPDDAQQLSLSEYPNRGDQTAKKLVSNFIAGKIKELFLAGDTGRGKTGLAISAAKALSESGVQTLFLPMEKYIDLWRIDQDFRNLEKSNIAKIAEHVEVLVIDDMGVEVTTKHTVEQTEKLIQARHNASRRTLITSNMSIDGLGEYWFLKEYERSGFQPGKRIVSRLKGWYLSHMLSCSDLRQGA